MRTPSLGSLLRCFIGTFRVSGGVKLKAAGRSICTGRRDLLPVAQDDQPRKNLVAPRPGLFRRRLLLQLRPMRLLSLMHRSHGHPLVFVVLMIHPRIVLMMGVLPPHHVLVVLPSMNHPMRPFLVVVRMRALLLVVLGVAGIRSWSGRLKSLWLFSLTTLILLAARP